MAQKTIPTLTPDMAGCWFDCTRGIYIGERVIKMAIAYGWDTSEFRESDFTVYGHEEDPEGDPEGYDWAQDAAEEYLDSLAPEGYRVGYSDGFGDFGMWEVESEEEGEDEQPIGCGHASCDVDSLPTLTHEED